MMTGEIKHWSFVALLMLCAAASTTIFALEGVALNAVFHRAPYRCDVDFDWPPHAPAAAAGDSGFASLDFYDVTDRARARARAMAAALDAAADPPVRVDGAWWTITELRKNVRARGLDHKGKKPALLQRLEEDMQEEHDLNVLAEKAATKKVLMKLY